MIDIIIPVYNTPLNDLERCLISILKQTYNNYIVYIIDDGSNNETKVFLDEFCKNKSNFIVKHIKNEGVSNARNIGIEISQSEYITFVDADDTLIDTFLEEAFAIIKEYNLDLVIGGYNEVINNQITKQRLCLPGIHIYENDKLIHFYEKLLTSKTNENNKELGDCPTGRIYTRLFRRLSLNNLKFNTNVHMSEDTLFMIDYIDKNKKIGVVNKIWYNYYINNYSISNATKKDKLISNIEDFITEIYTRYHNESNEIIKEAYLKRIKKSNEYINELKKPNQ